MARKRKVVGNSSGSEEAATQEEDGLNSKRLRPEDLFDDDTDEFQDSSVETQPRRSSRSRKGRGGSIQQLQNIERAQLTRSSQDSRRLGVVTQGQSINPMAPSHPDDAEDDQEERAWATRKPSTPPGSPVRPTFTLSQQSGQFGFKLPSSNARGQNTTVPTVRLSTKSSSVASRPHSRSASMFSARNTHSPHTAPTSRAPSECEQDDDQETMHRNEQASPPKLRKSQLCQLAAAAESRGTTVSRVHGSPAQIQRSSSQQSSRQAHSGIRDISTSGRSSSGQGQRFSSNQAQPSRLPRSTTLRVRDVQQSSIDSNGNRGGVREIDEVSPDEDERSAEAVIRNDARQPQTRVVTDVVAQHRQRNRAPRLPDNARLLAVRNQQASASQHSGSGGRANSVSDKGDEVELSISSADPNRLPQSIRPPTSASTGADPSQLNFYPPAVRDIIERAKQFSHCDLASVSSFPLRLQFNVKAAEYLSEAIAERRERGLIIPEGWWPQYTSDLAKLLWEDIGSWRSALKKKARAFVRERYEWDPQNRRSINAELAKALLDRGSFLKHGRDEEGHTNNLAHPALSAVIIEFFYAGSNSVGSIFPEVFEDQVPRAAVALAATAIKLAIDEIAAEGKEVTFKRDVYADIYSDILGLMTKCDSDPIHRAKTKELRVHWAKIGRNGTNKENSTGFDVDLD